MLNIVEIFQEFYFTKYLFLGITILGIINILKKIVWG